MKLDVTPVFTRNYASDKKIKVNRGGTRSSKTRSIAQLSVLWLFTGQISRDRQISEGVWSTVRKYSTTLDATVIRDFEEELDKQGLYEALRVNKTKRTYTYGKRMVEFFGADDEKKLRGAKRNILYCNEANELEFKTQFFQLLIRTESDVFIDFNPDDENVWINTELEQKRFHDLKDVEVIVSTYKDNTFLPASLIKEIEYLQQNDPEFWKVYGLGEYGKIYGIIFSDYKVVDRIPDGATHVSNAIDFGFTNDPCAIIEVYKQNGELWINQLEYKRGMTNQDIASRLKELGIDREYTICDSAEPKSIKELENLQINVYPAEKGPDSIINSIDILKRYKLNVTANSTDLIKEFRTYKWALDKSANPTNKPVDYNNHCFTGETLITTNQGQVRIDMVNEGDYVLTSQGYKRVLKRFNNGVQLVNNYSMQYDTFSVSLRSTKEHKVKTLDTWTKISKLKPGQQTFLHKSSTTKTINSIQKKGISHVVIKDYTLPYMNTTMVKFLKVITYIIKMGIRGIMKSLTSNYLKLINICKNMVSKGLKQIKFGLMSFTLKELRKQKSGTNQKKDCNGTQNMVNYRGIKEYPLNENVTNAKKNTPHISQQEVNSAITTARLNHLEIGENQYELTYDLMIEDCHEYFANGLLVHNCIDALRYVALNKLSNNNNGVYYVS